VIARPDQPQSAPSPYALAAQIKRKARDLGFDLVGIASPEPSRYRDYFHRWLHEGQHGDMAWLANRVHEKTAPEKYFPGVQSIICVALNYYTRLEEEPTRSETASTPPIKGKIARYALGDDYHELIKPRLHALADWLKQIAPTAETRACVDTAPVMEKELAARAGIGWQGKNTCAINESIGSWLFLGEIFTTLPLPPDNPATDRCGSCRRCIDACPTQAITAPYQLNATKCISYLTIEHRTEISPDLANKISPWLYGCDICQEVCPWNRQPPEATDAALRPRFPSGAVNLSEIKNWTPEDYRAQLKNSAIKRVKLPQLKRNAEKISHR
jgi:epoxyqueuosine reductase